MVLTGQKTLIEIEEKMQNISPPNYKLQNFEGCCITIGKSDSHVAIEPT